MAGPAHRASVTRTAALLAVAVPPGADPLTALKTGIASTEATTAPPASISRYSPISSPARSGIRRLTRLGSSTFISAMAAPATTVPGKRSSPG